MGVRQADAVVDLVVVLGLPEIAGTVKAAASSIAASVRIERVETLQRLEDVSDSGARKALLIAAGTSVIVPARILGRFPAGAINFHAASPNYPGRDPHHFAAYDQCDRYGATAHVMTERVDDGPILDAEEEAVEPGAGPHAYLAVGQRCLARLLERIVPRLITGEIQPAGRIAWGNNKTTRRDFQALCQIDPLCDDEEIARRIRAADMPGYANAHVDIAGYRFRIDGPAPARSQDFQNFEQDFTETGYADLLDRAAERYRFVGFGSAAAASEPSVLWRHDIDFSIHRARKLSSLEAAHGLKATYFVMLGSQFYNPFEATPRALLREIIADGHDIGLHFDPDILAEKKNDLTEVESEIAWEAATLERLLGTQVAVVSIHNPDFDMPWLDRDALAGLINAYGAGIGEKFSYVSDSNGVWRHRRLRAAIEEDSPPFLHVLTHPVWWVADPLPARARIRRAVEGRAQNAMRDYDRGLAYHRRPNVR